MVIYGKKASSFRRDPAQRPHFIGILKKPGSSMVVMVWTNKTPALLFFCVIVRTDTTYR